MPTPDGRASLGALAGAGPIGWALAVARPAARSRSLLVAPCATGSGCRASLLLFLLVVVVVAAIGGLLPGAVAAVARLAAARTGSSRRRSTRSRSREGENLLALVVFLVVAAVVSVLVDARRRRRARRGPRACRGRDARRARRDAGRASEDPLPTLVAQLARPRSSSTRSRVLRAGRDDDWHVEAAAGEPVADDARTTATVTVPLGDARVLVAARARAHRRGPARCSTRSPRQLAGRGRAPPAAGRGGRGRGRSREANELRTALLAAVSHDLRTPLASIKASASSLLPARRRRGRRRRRASSSRRSTTRPTGSTRSSGTCST